MEQLDKWPKTEWLDEEGKEQVHRGSGRFLIEQPGAILVNGDQWAVLFRHAIVDVFESGEIFISGKMLYSPKEQEDTSTPSMDCH